MNPLTHDQILGCLITYNRQLAGVTIRQLAEALDQKYQHIWDLENGLRPVTRIRILSIIKALKLSPETYWKNLPEAIKKLKKE